MKRFSVFPGFIPALGFTVAYVSLLVLVPLAALAWKATGLGWTGFVEAVTTARALASLRVSFGCALVAALVNVPLGLWVAWVLARYPFPGRRVLDALVDLPLVLPTAVAGIALSALYGPKGWLGEPLLHWGVRVAYTPVGIVMALVFVGFPFMVRSVQPVLAELEPDMEEAAATLGAGRFTIVVRIILPVIFPALLTGFALAFARAVGEYGSVIFIAGNMPFETEIAPLLIVTHLEQYEYGMATALGVAMLSLAFAGLLAINVWQWLYRRRRGLLE